ncbi:OTU domain-containing protein 3 [Taenia solium]|eukprot:TsM_000132100 transcript=TsM_000132100 gene=TsM_000132100
MVVIYIALPDSLIYSGLILRSVPLDGNCLFSAFGDQLTGDIRDHARLRVQAVTFLRNHCHEMRPFCGDRSYKQMVRELAVPGTYGDHMSIVALARVYAVDVIVHRLGQPPRLVARGCTSPSCAHPQIHLAYNGNIEHYSSVRSRNGSPTGPADVYMDLRRLEKEALRSLSCCHRRSDCKHHKHHCDQEDRKISHKMMLTNLN